MAGTIMVHADLPRSSVAQLVWIAQQRGTSMTEALRRAVENEAFFVEQASKGVKILIEDVRGRISQVGLG